MEITKRISVFFGFASIVMLLMFINIQSIDAKPDTVKVFMAGAATANITPFLGGGIVGNYGNPPPAAHVHDELHARCLVLDDGATKLVFIIVDNIAMQRDLIDKAKTLIEEETNIPRANVLVSATHTHSSVSSGGYSDLSSVSLFDDYQNLLIRRMADVTRIALNNLEPAQIGWGAGNVPEHVFVRRWKMKPGAPPIINPFGEEDQAVMNPGRWKEYLLEPAGVPDTEVSFISVKSVTGKPIALLANYSLHYVGGVPKDHLSADYFAVFADRIQELLKADRQEVPFVGIMSNGTSGDVNNINYGGTRVRKAPYEQMKLVAEDVAREVYRVHNSIQFHDWVTVGAAEEELKLEVRKASPELLERSKEIIARPETVEPVHRHEVTYAKRVLRHQENWPDEVNIVLQAFRIGDVGIAAIPFEAFAEIGLEIKAESPLQPSFTIDLANGIYGYLPTPEQHELGGYETWLPTNKVEVEASRKIVAKLLDLFEKIK